MRDFVKIEIVPHVDAWEEAGSFPRDLYRKIGKLGVLGIGYPEALGGTDADLFFQIVVFEEVARRGSGGILASLLSHTIGLPPVAKFGSEALKHCVVPGVLSGAKIVGLAVTEPGGGSDVAALKTTAVRDGDHFNGSRSVPSLTSWVCVGRTRTRFFFEDCEVPAENVPGTEGGGVKVLMSGLDYERAVLFGGPLGIMAACMDVVLTRTTANIRAFHRRVPVDAGQAGGHVHHLVGLPCLRLRAGAACDRADHARSLRGDAAEAILYAAEKATWMAGEAIQLLGGNGYINEYPTPRLW